MNPDREAPRGGLVRNLFYAALLGSLAIAAYFLVAEHRAHIFSGPWSGPILLAAFIGLHLLMHAGHGGHGGHGDGSGGGRSPDERRSSRKGIDDER